MATVLRVSGARLETYTAPILRVSGAHLETFNPNPHLRISGAQIEAYDPYAAYASRNFWFHDGTEWRPGILAFHDGTEWILGADPV